MSVPVDFSANKRDARLLLNGLWFVNKWRTRASEIGVQAAARLMRKQGVPCDVAVSILATR